MRPGGSGGAGHPHSKKFRIFPAELASGGGGRGRGRRKFPVSKITTENFENFPRNIWSRLISIRNVRQISRKHENRFILLKKKKKSATIAF